MAAYEEAQFPLGLLGDNAVPEMLLSEEASPALTVRKVQIGSPDRTPQLMKSALLVPGDLVQKLE